MDPEERNPESENDKMMKVTYLPEAWYGSIKIKSDNKPSIMKCSEWKEIYGTDIDDYHLFVKETDVPGIFSYGARQLKDGSEHKAGYVWSSSTGVMNRIFGLKLIQVVIEGSGCYAMDINELKPLVEEFIGHEVGIGKSIKFSEDVYYKFTNVDGRMIG